MVQYFPLTINKEYKKEDTYNTNLLWHCL